ncbi:TPA: CSS-motif domain-containing protein [Klebsiella aerogenes]|nr:CSS-motif domain-containing protein [Klebsiella aerogenes]HDU3701954.1 CSS-motif domain-containing protein [Klebsiella aerogenes]HDU3712602.1 CSS-motif domain-containing protein [Klebsiella aerogenes]
MKRDSAVTADILINQIDHVTSIARNATQSTAQLASKPCKDFLQKMTEIGTFTPYIHSTGILRHDILICSSFSGMRQFSSTEIYGTSVSAVMCSLKIAATRKICSC